MATVASSDITTIKVSKTLRDRITAGAAEQHQTIQRFIEGVLDTYERNRRFAAVAAAIGSADADTLRGWRDETASWDVVDTGTDTAVDA